ncbi:hypothetical protein IWW38_004086, partial [Coemansia aciculifera]
CYSSRIALWIHYCNQCSNGDVTVTGPRLADYVEWMVSSGAAERIRQGTTHIQQVLRNQLQGVICYWRIQNDDRADAADPRKSHVFLAKWHDIVQRYPRDRPSRRSEPIYGAQLPGAHSEAVIRPSPHAGAATSNNWRPAISRPSGGAGSRPIASAVQIQQQQHHHQQSLHRHRYPSTTHSPVSNGFVHGSPQPSGRASNSHLPRAGGFNGHPIAPNKYIAPQSASNAAPGNATEVSRMSSVSLEYEDESRAGTEERISSYQRAPPGRPNGHIPQQVPKSDASLLMPEQNHRGEFPDEMPIWEPDLRKVPEGYLLVSEEVAALNLRQLEINNVQQSQARAFYNLGLASWLSVEQRLALTLADVFMDDNSNLPIQEQQFLLPLPHAASPQPAVQRDELVVQVAGVSGEENAVHSSAPASPDRNGDGVVARKAESLPSLSPAPEAQDSSEEKAPAAGLALAATVSSARTMSVAICSPNGGTHSGMTQILRHSNPLLCTWSALAIMFFRKWHVANEPTPDFESTQWLSEKLFTQDFDLAFKIACKDISSDM